MPRTLHSLRKARSGCPDLGPIAASVDALVRVLRLDVDWLLVLSGAQGHWGRHHLASHLAGGQASIVVYRKRRQGAGAGHSDLAASFENVALGAVLATMRLGCSLAFVQMQPGSYRSLTNLTDDPDLRLAKACSELVIV